MTATDDAAADGQRAFRVFKALRDDPDAQARAQRFVDELVALDAARPTVEALDGLDDEQLAADLRDITDPPPWPVAPEG